MSNYSPVIFIGPQIMKKYNQHWPTQIELVQLLWSAYHSEIDESKFYARLNKLEQEIKLTHPDWKNQQIEVEMLAYISNQIAFEYDEAFYNGTLKLDGFSQKDAYFTKIPPFKQGIKKILQFLALDQIDEVERSPLSELLENTSYIVTSSYAVFIEELLEAQQKKYRIYMEAKGVFEELDDTLNLYKMNGSIHQPASIIFTEKDKEKNKNNEIVLFTKLAALAEERPLLFIGYETTDSSYQHLLKGIFGYPKEQEGTKATIALINLKGSNETIAQKTYLDETTKQEIKVINSSNETLIYEYLKATYFSIGKVKKPFTPTNGYAKVPFDKLEQSPIATKKRTTVFDLKKPVVATPKGLERKPIQEASTMKPSTKLHIKEDAGKPKEKFDLDTFLAHLELEDEQKNKANLASQHREKARKAQGISKTKMAQEIQTESFQRKDATARNQRILSRKEKYQQEKTGYAQKKAAMPSKHRGLKHRTKKRKENVMKYSLILCATILLLGFLLTKFFFSPAVVEGESMMPTLTSSDYVLLNKFDLDVTRFEVIAFKSPDDPKKDYIKRVIGMPGDTIEVKKDVLYINNKAQDETYLAKEREELQEGEKLMKDFTLKELTGVSTVPPNKLFVMGDNRLYSRDSREFGFIDQQDIKGRANLIIWPFSRVNSLE